MFSNEVADMARAAERLSARTVQTVKDRGLHADGKGLYLRIGPTGSKSWIYRYRTGDRQHDLGLGPYPDITLAEARERATEQRKLRLNGHDPLLTRRASRDQARLTAAKAMTFRQCADGYIAAHRAGWRNAVHAGTWPQSLRDYVYPVFGDLPIQSIDIALVMRALEPIWNTKSETASRVRGRIERVLDWATARGYRTGENPARWRGHLENLLPAPRKVQRVEHHPALPYPEIAAFMADLHQLEGIAARALEFLILTAARSGEVIGAKWGEFNLAERLWTVPADRMKANREHRVPLCEPAMTILGQMAEVRTSDYVFPGRDGGRPISKIGLFYTLRRMNRGDLTAHGFRSSFRDWTAERTNFPAEVAEMALAHVVGDKVEAAYRRGDLFQKRRQLGDAWARFCTAPAMAGKVVAIGVSR
jgi:integrase